MPSAPRTQHTVPQHAPPQATYSSQSAAAAEFDCQNARHIAQMDDLMALLHKNLLEDPLIFKMGVQDEVLAAGHKCTLGFDLDGCTISKVLPGGPAFATRQVAEGDTIVEVDRRQATEQNILRCLVGDDIEGSICKLRLLKAESGAGQPVEVIIRRARTDVVQEQELAFQLLTDLKHHAVQNNDAESATFVEKLGRQFVRIVLDRQDKERALAVQHKNLQEDSLRTLEELHKGIHKHLFPLQQNSLTLQNVKELEEELSRHIALEQELKKLIDALERQLESANATEMDLRRQLQTVIPAMHDKVLQAEEQFKATQNELVQVQELADQLHASLEQETGLKKAMVLELQSQKEINQATTLELQSLQESNQAMVLELSSQKDINSEGSRKLLEAHDKAKLLEEVLALQEHPHGNKGALDIATQHDGKITELQDLLYHKEEALWLLREELASKDRHIKAIEDDFEELKHMLNEFDVLSAKLSVVTLERDQMALQLSQSSTSQAIQQNRNSQPDSRVGDTERTYGRSVCSVDYLPPPSVIPQSVEDAMPPILKGNEIIRYMPSPPKTPGDTYGDSYVSLRTPFAPASSCVYPSLYLYYAAVS